MNYDDAFKHYKEGTANDEEKEFVKQEIAKARALASLLEDDSVSANAAEIKRADAEEIKAAKKEFSWRGMLIGLIAMIVLIVADVVIIAGLATWGFFSIRKSYKKVKGQNVADENAKD